MKQLLRKIAYLILFVTIGQIVFGFIIERSYLKELSVNKIHTGSIVYLGDSTITSFSNNDTNKRPISALLEDRIKQKVTPVTHSAYHLGIYKDYVEYILENYTPEEIIIPINMRSFSPEWDTRPGYQFIKESFLLNNGRIGRMFYSPLSTYTSMFRATNEHAWLNSQVFDNDILIGKVVDFENATYLKNSSVSNMKNKIIFHYRYKLTSNHRKISALRNICSVAKQNNIKVIFYVTPIDIDYVDSVYPGTADLIVNNIKVVLQVINSYGLNAIDMSHSIPSDYFDWRVNTYPNEHLNEKGRIYVADLLSSAMSK